jgi:hypothetical protein
MEVLRWASSKHCPCGVDTWCAAVRCAGNKRGNYRPLHLLHAMKRPWSEAVLAAAAPYEEVQTWLQARLPGLATSLRRGRRGGCGRVRGCECRSGVNGTGVQISRRAFPC